MLWLIIFAHVLIPCLLWSHIRQGQDIDLSYLRFSAWLSQGCGPFALHRGHWLALGAPGWEVPWAKAARAQLCCPWASQKSKQSFGAYLASSHLICSYVFISPPSRDLLMQHPQNENIFNERKRNFWHQISACVDSSSPAHSKFVFVIFLFTQFNSACQLIRGKIPVIPTLGILRQEDC